MWSESTTSKSFRGTRSRPKCLVKRKTTLSTRVLPRVLSFLSELTAHAAMSLWTGAPPLPRGHRPLGIRHWVHLQGILRLTHFGLQQAPWGGKKDSSDITLFTDGLCSLRMGFPRIINKSHLFFLFLLILQVCSRFSHASLPLPREVIQDPSRCVIHS